MDTLKEVLVYLGLGHPLARASVAFIIVELLTVFTKPSFAYDEAGRPKGWVLTGGTTWMPFWLPGVLAFIVFSAL